MAGPEFFRPEPVPRRQPGGASGPPHSQGRPHVDAPLSTLPEAVRRLGDRGRLAMHFILTVLEQPPSQGRWWVVYEPEAAPEGDPDRLTAWMEPRDELSDLDDVFALIEDIPTVPGALARRVLVAVGDPGATLFAVEYAHDVRWHVVLPEQVRKQLIRP